MSQVRQRRRESAHISNYVVDSLITGACTYLECTRGCENNRVTIHLVSDFCVAVEQYCDERAEVVMLQGKMGGQAYKWKCHEPANQLHEEAQANTAVLPCFGGHDSCETLRHRLESTAIR